MRNDNSEQIVGEQIGSYTVVGELGRGGMAVVYEVCHQTLGKRAALKMLLPGICEHPEIRARFEREGKAAARVHHPHVVQVFDVGTHRDQPWLVMEFLEGGDLKRHLAARGALSVEVALDLMIPVLAGVQAAHDEGVVHRDLKPANIVLADQKNGDLRPVVVDFGVARAVQADFDELQTRSGMVIGTPAYLSPEQAHGKQATERSDQYALGVMLYECLAGRRAFVGASPFELMEAVVRGICVPLGTLRPDLPLPLVLAIARAMSLRAEDRHPSVRALGAALLPFASARGRAIWSTTFGVEAATPVPLVAGQPAAIGDPVPQTTETPYHLPVLVEVPPTLTRSTRARLTSITLLAALGVFSTVFGFALMRPSRNDNPEKNSRNLAQGFVDRHRRTADAAIELTAAPSATPDVSIPNAQTSPINGAREVDAGVVPARTAAIERRRVRQPSLMSAQSGSHARSSAVRASHAAGTGAGAPSGASNCPNGICAY